jgi:3-methyladenine DNA glycosylase Mpg
MRSRDKELFNGQWKLCQALSVKVGEPHSVQQQTEVMVVFSAFGGRSREEDRAAFASVLFHILRLLVRNLRYCSKRFLAGE